MKTVICADSLEWLPANRNQGAVITSLPEAVELGMENLQEYGAWFIRAAHACFSSSTESCPVIFSQTDKRAGGVWLDKAHLLHGVADSLGYRCLWHKIELRDEPGTKNLFRPGYRHLIAFGNGTAVGDAAGNLRSEDVIRKSEVLYEDGIGFAAVEIAVNFCLHYTKKILDPFCGRGTVLFVAERKGAEVTGVDISPVQCMASRQQQFLF